MQSTLFFIFLLHRIINNLAIPVPVETIYKCRPGGKYTDPVYKRNIEAALNAVATDIAASKGFCHANATNGKSDQVNAIGLCPRYVKPDICAACVKKSIPGLMSNCPDDKEAVVWATNCMLRYSNRTIFGVLDNWVVAIDVSKDQVTFVRRMDNAMAGLINRLLKKASTQKYADGYNMYVKREYSVIALFVALQCSPDLSTEDCSKCLFGQQISIHPCCSGKVSGRLLAPNCYIRFGHARFFDG